MTLFCFIRYSTSIRSSTSAVNYKQRTIGTGTVTIKDLKIKGPDITKYYSSIPILMHLKIVIIILLRFFIVILTSSTLIVISKNNQTIKDSNNNLKNYYKTCLIYLKKLDSINNLYRYNKR